ncbi:F177A protein, partial [Nothocercus nigrocapillus]|nr:F177A protein [Nothocercus nigrocapillus]
QQLANGERGFENVELGVIGKKKKIPRRVIHFASGETMEEYSTDEEEDEQEKKDLLPPVDPVASPASCCICWGRFSPDFLWPSQTPCLELYVLLDVGEEASGCAVDTSCHRAEVSTKFCSEEEEEEQENKMSEEAERQHQEQQNKAQAEAPVQTDQPEATACSSFVNLNFEAEGDCQPVVEVKQDGVTVPP